MAETKNYNYETRCKRCGTINIQKEKMTQEFNVETRILMELNFLCANPRQYDCSYCKKITVQEVIFWEIED